MILVGVWSMSRMTAYYLELCLDSRSDSEGARVGEGTRMTAKSLIFGPNSRARTCSRIGSILSRFRGYENPSRGGLFVSLNVARE
jgi:hypothetical protein